MAFDESLYVTAKFTTARGLTLSKQSNALTIKDTSLATPMIVITNGPSRILSTKDIYILDRVTKQRINSVYNSNTEWQHTSGVSPYVLDIPKAGTWEVHGSIADSKLGILEFANGLTEVVDWHSMGHEYVVLASVNLTKVPNYLPESITRLSHMFYGATAFNQDISMWNVSNVTDMIYMFYNATAFNKPLNNWNVSNVTDMGFMFNSCTSFDQSLNTWDVSKVTDMNLMFYDCAKFNQPLSNWNTINVTKMKAMFYNCSNFNQNINNWNVSNVSDMYGMFSGCINFNQPLGNWNTSKVTDMTGMFQHCTKFNQSLNRWCVPLIVSKPTAFNFNAPNLTDGKLPVWGTCPV